MHFFKGIKIHDEHGKPRWAVMASFDIPCKNEQLYLRRLRIIQTPWFGVYLHETTHPDQDRDLHDHPWNFWSFVLKGGYTELFTLDGNTKTNKFNRFSFHKMSRLAFHKITELNNVPTWTVIFAGKRVREWGFSTDNGWIPWYEYKEKTNGSKMV